jgi:hypothetical protein
MTNIGKYGSARSNSLSIDFLVFRIVLFGPTPYQKAVGSLVISFIWGYSLQTSLRLFQSG